MLILWRTKSKRWTSLANLQSHEDSRGPGTEAHDEVLGISQHLGPLLTIAADCMDVLPKICGLIDVNALETVPPEGSMAIYENASLLEHSCMANTRHSFHIDEKGRPRITVYAVTSIKRYKADIITRLFCFLFLKCSFNLVFSSIINIIVTINLFFQRRTLKYHVHSRALGYQS